MVLIHNEDVIPTVTNIWEHFNRTFVLGNKRKLCCWKGVFWTVFYDENLKTNQKYNSGIGLKTALFILYSTTVYDRSNRLKKKYRKNTEYIK